MSFLDELKRRNVLRIAGLYLVGAWLVVQVAGTVLPMFDATAWLPRTIVIVLAIGLIPALIVAWVFELTPEGLKREKDVDRIGSIAPQTGKRLDRIIMVVLSLALSYFAFDKFVLSPQREAKQVNTARKEGRSEALLKSYGDKSIAVLPFVTLSADKDQEYFADGLSEELLNLLAQVPELRVIARTSSFSFKGKEADIAEIAHKLNVASILEGSVRKSGDTLRITAQLVRASDSSHLWSQTYDRKMTDVFKVQDEISAAVVEQLKIKLLGAGPKTQIMDLKAYALYLQAREIFRQSSAGALQQSIALYQQALTIDPGYAAAWVGLARAYAAQSFWGLRSLDEGYGLAREATTRALGIDPEYAPAHAVLGQIAMVYDGDLAAAARHYQQAMSLDPTNPDIIGGAARLYRNLGRTDAALGLLQYVLRLDPVNPSGYAGLAHAYLALGRHEEAIENARISVDLNPGRASAQYILGLAFMFDDRLDEALAAMMQEPFEAWRLQGLAMVYHARGQKAESDAALAELMAKHEKAWSCDISYVLAFRGEADRSFDWLEKAVVYKDGCLSQIADNPLFANLHSDPRWLPFLRKIGKAPDQLDAIRFDVTPSAAKS